MPTNAIDAPYCLIAELTYRCPLQCPYCSNPVRLNEVRGELDTQTWQRLLEQAANLGIVQVHFTGGEPLQRKDLEELIVTSRTAGLYSHLITAGVNVDIRRLVSLRGAGLDAIQISLQDPQPESNDWLAGSVSFKAKQSAFLAAKQAGFPVTLNVVVHRYNLDRITEIIRLADEWQADRLEIAHVQYLGWAYLNRRALLPSLEQLRRAESVVAEARAVSSRKTQIIHVLPDYFQQWPKACMGGWGRVYMTVNPDGMILPCQAARSMMNIEFPYAGDSSLEEAWRSSAFERFRGTDWMSDPCRSCDRREVDFGGCRCQAHLVVGDESATDPVCHLSPHRRLIDRALEGEVASHDELQFRRYR